jgi:hypothetical protein
MEVSGQFHVPAEIAMENLFPLLGMDLQPVAPELVRILWNTEKFLAPNKNQTLSIQTIAHHYTN